MVNHRKQNYIGRENVFRIVKKATEITHDILRDSLREDDIAVDATLGKGNDTVFLSSILGKGRVFAFDIQEEALEGFKDIIREKKLQNVVTIRDGHENIDLYIKDKIGAAVFNLGYLPGGNPSIITRPDTTITAIKKCLELLRPGGVLTIALYTGHSGGEEEAAIVHEFASKLDSRKYSVMDIHYTNKAGRAPYLIVIEMNDN